MLDTTNISAALSAVDFDSDSKLRVNSEITAITDNAEATTTKISRECCI